MGHRPLWRGQLDLGHHLHHAAITLHVQKNVLPSVLCPVSAALASVFRMTSISTSYTFPLLFCSLATAVPVATAAPAALSSPAARIFCLGAGHGCAVDQWHREVRLLTRPAQEGRCKATWKMKFKLLWRDAGPPNHLDGKVDSDQ